MQYTQGQLGRVFVARLEDGESVYEVVEEIAGFPFVSNDDLVDSSVMALMRRIPRPGLVTFAKIEFWGGLVSGIVYIASHALMMFVSFRAIAPLAGGAGMPMTPYAGGPNSPGMAATASAGTKPSTHSAPGTPSWLVAW